MHLALLIILGLGPEPALAQTTPVVVAPYAQDAAPMPQTGCTDVERLLLEDLAKYAKGRVEEVWFTLYGPTAYDRDQDRVSAARGYARLFFGDDVFTPDEDGRSYEPAVEATLETMKNRLLNIGAAVECLPPLKSAQSYKPKDDAEKEQVKAILEKVKRCGPYAAYVWNLKPPVELCSTFFEIPREEQIRTLVHESAHLAKIGTPDGEAYCEGAARITASGDLSFKGEFTCKQACGAPSLNTADNWSQWVYCSWLGSDGAKAAGAKPD